MGNHRAAYDCQQCGACCTIQGSMPATGYVSLAPEESKRMKRLGLTVVQAAGLSYLGTRYRADAPYPVCVALRGEVGQSCRCNVYENRPRNCRQFEVGSRLCQEAREKAGLSS
jgi:Fe-S-cluster containining protein